jgi:uncharacterized membrane protein YgcG
MRGRLNGGMPEPTRIEAGRRRAQVAKRTLAVTAATGFAVALALVRHGQPATANSSSTRTGSQSRSTPSSQGERRGFSFGGGSIAPSSNESPSFGTSTS